MRNQQKLNQLPGKQRGINLIAASVTILFLAIVVNTAVKLMPIYTDYWSFSKILSDLVEEPATASMTRGEFKSALQSRFISNRIEHRKLSDVKIEVKSKVMTIDGNYEIRTNYFANLDIVVKFDQLVFKIQRN
jgi:hypothetical protein